MARVYISERWEDGDVLVPDDVNAELENYVGEMNGHIDRDNVSNDLITGAKVALDAFNGIMFVEGAGPVSITGGVDNRQHWYSVVSGTLVTGDGRIQCEASATFDKTSAAGSNHWTVDLGIRIDGKIVGRSGGSSECPSDTLSAIACPPVGPGTHTVEIVVRMTALSHYTVGQGSPTLDVNGHALWARYLRR